MNKRYPFFISKFVKQNDNMRYTSKDRAILLLEDGKYFEGYSAGKKGTTTGEICFNTGMTGYQEIFTDPSYYGQILVATNAQIGNYGTNDEDVESDGVKIEGFICKKFSDIHSRPAAKQSLQEYFEEQQIVAISDVDTRAVVRYIRDKGAMNCIISSEETNIERLKEQLSKVPSMQGLELSSKVSTKEPYFLGNEDSPIKIAVIDYGVKQNILRSLIKRNCFLKVFPMKTTIQEIQEWQPDGIMLSNGPGDPSVMDEEQERVKEMTQSDIPIFGICMGHQLLALAAGLSTYKMHNGHRGINHPIKNLITGKSEITTQNHGFVVNLEEAQESELVEPTHIHLNDNTLAGIRFRNKNIFSVQYHPEAFPGPHDSVYLFDQFIANIKKTMEVTA